MDASRKDGSLFRHDLLHGFIEANLADFDSFALSLAPELVKSPAQYKKLLVEAHDLSGDADVSEPQSCRC